MLELTIPDAWLAAVREFDMAVISAVVQLRISCCGFMLARCCASAKKSFIVGNSRLPLDPFASKRKTSHSVFAREMKMENRFKLVWDEEELARAFRVTPRDVREYLTDGRRVSFIIERRLMWENPGWSLAPSEGAGYDLLDPDGGMWEVRSITRQGVYFNPSNQVGSGRKFDENGFRAKLGGVKGFILSDIVDFPEVDVFVVPVENVARWHDRGELGSNAKVSRAKFLSRLAPDIR